MAKVIMTIAPEDGMNFDEMMSFQTENYIGIWDCASEQFALIKKSSKYFEAWYLPNEYETFKELDDAIYDEVEEHITEVFKESNYTITLG